jgi:hypothetical protein
MEVRDIITRIRWRLCSESLQNAFDAMEAFSPFSVPAMERTSVDGNDTVRLDKLNYMLVRNRLPLIAKW